MVVNINNIKASQIIMKKRRSGDKVKWSKRSSVALDERTYKIAKSLPNFSRFVSDCLISYSETGAIMTSPEDASVVEINYDRLSGEVIKPLRELVSELETLVSILEKSTLKEKPDETNYIPRDKVEEIVKEIEEKMSKEISKQISSLVDED